MKQRQIRNRLGRQELAHHYRESLLQSKLEAQETTLKSVSEELHDNINQVLTFAVMELNSVREQSSHEEIVARVSAAKDTIRSAINNIRLVSHSLNTGLVEERDLSDAIALELRRIEAFSGIKCILETDEEAEPSPEQKLLLFRIAQEALQNALKHAEATEIRINLSSTASEYTLSIADNGVGFKVPGQNVSDSLGMRNMNERIELLRGKLSIQSAIGQGTTITASIPLKQSNGDN